MPLKKSTEWNAILNCRKKKVVFFYIHILITFMSSYSRTRLGPFTITRYLTSVKDRFDRLINWATDPKVIDLHFQLLDTFGYIMISEHGACAFIIRTFQFHRY